MAHILLKFSVMNIYDHAAKNLQQKRDKLIREFFEGDMKDFHHRYTGIIDDYFREQFEKSMIGPMIGFEKNPYAIIALGGYGREEQCLYSDIDILFLFKKRVPEEAEALIREIIYPLWDIGLDIGHATRSLKECIALAARDFEVLTSLLDARFICGMSPVYIEFRDILRKKVIDVSSEKIITWLVDSAKKRHEQFGDSPYLLEPNLKEGQGGLRDYHAMLWICQIRYNLKIPRDLEYQGRLSYREYQMLTESLLLIWNVRTCLHHLVGRRYDRLHFEHQMKIADIFKHRKTNGQKPVEIFLSDLHSRMEFVKTTYQTIVWDVLSVGKRGPKKKIRTTVQGLEVKGYTLNFSSAEAILSSPYLLIRIFEESAHLDIPLSAESKRLIGEFAYLIDDDFRTSKMVVQCFERILSIPTSQVNVLYEMLNTGFLVKFIPEFRRIANRIEYDSFHLYPVDKHCLRTVWAIKQFKSLNDTPDNRLINNIFDELGSNTILLLWAAFLHDIGKGEPESDHCKSGAEIVPHILSRMGYSPAEIETVSFLVSAHLFLIGTVIRRDINDEETAVFSARWVKDTNRLKMLYLLTIADCMATGPKAWNEWTSVLLRELFLKVINVLEKGELASHEASEKIEKRKSEVLSSNIAPLSELENLTTSMSEQYFLYTPTPDIVNHIKLFRTMGDSEFVWNIEPCKGLNMRTLTMCIKDRPGIFSKISGVFTLNGIDILDAQVYTWKNRISLIIFQVRPPIDPLHEKERWERAEKNLQSAISSNLNLAEALKEKMAGYLSFKPKTSERPHRIIIDNTSSSFFTIVEVFTYDVPGVLYKITDTLFRCGLDIRNAQITTLADRVIDVFYVLDIEGQKTYREELIRHSIEQILPGVSDISRE